MAQSVGTIKLPIVSTFDPAGVLQAKAGLRDLQQAGQSAAGGGGGAAGGGGGAAGGGQQPSPKSRDFIGMRSGLQAAAREFGGPAGGLISDMMSPDATVLGTVVGVAALGFGLIRLSKSIGDEERRRSALSGVAIQDFSRMSVAADQAGLTVGDLSKSLAEFGETALGAQAGDMRRGALMAALGVNPGNMVSSLNQAQAGLGRLSGDARTRAAVALYGERGGEMADALDHTHRYAGVNGLQAGGLSTMGNSLAGVGTWFKAELGQFFADLSPEAARAEARKALRAENEARIHDLQQMAAPMFGQSLGPEQIYRQEIKKIDMLAEKQAFLPAGDLSANRAVGASVGTEARARRLTALSQYMMPSERSWEQSELITARRSDRKLSDDQAEMALIENNEAKAEAYRSGRSYWENLQADLQIAQRKYDFPGQTNEEKQFAARRASNEVMDYANTMTRSGGLAGAHDMNTVAGYSQMVGAEYEQQQSIASRHLAEMLIQHLPPALAAAIRASFGYLRQQGPMN